MRGNNAFSRNTRTFSVGVARKGWLTKQDVINTLPLEKLQKELLKKRTRIG